MKLASLVLAAVVGATSITGICRLCEPSAGRGEGASLSPRQTAEPRMAAAGTLLATRASRPAAATVVLHIEGMTCGGCTLATRTVLERLPGVSKAEVSYEAQRAVVTYDPAKVTVKQMIAAVATLKYTATVVTPGAPAAGPATKPSARS